MSQNPYDPPPQLPPQQPAFNPHAQGDATGGLIPYKNAPALMAYYFSIGTLLCCITPIPLGIVPLVLGIKGLQKRKLQPEVKGSVHAWIGIVLGGASALCSFLMIIGLIVGIIFDAGK